MKAHTSDFKEKIKEFGRELDSKITYGTTELGKEELNSVTPHYESTILKSVMKQLDVDSNVEIPLETVINYQFGVKVGNEYEYLDYGNYVVYNVEKQEDTRSWKITCYDKMLYAMIPYESLGVSYPITIKNYLQAICTKLGLTLASGSFANEDKQIMNELYLDANGNGLDYTFRDVLDEIAQATGSTICINEDDELEVRYPQNVGEYETVEGTNLTLENVDDVKDIDYELNGDTVQDGTPTPTTPIDVETVTGRQEIKVEGKNRFDYTKNPLYENAVNTETIDGGIKVSIRTAGGYRYAVYDLGETSQLTGKTIRVKARFEASSTNIPSYALIYCNDSGGNRSSIVATTTSNEIISTIVANNNTHIALSLYANNSSTSQPIDTYVNFYDILVTIDEEDMTYEEYKGQSYEINLGKNLFDNTTSTFSNPSRVNITTTTDTITITTVGETTSNNLFFRTKIPDYYLENGKTYTLSSENVSGVSSSLKLQLRNKNGSNANKPNGDSIVYDSNYSLFIVGNIFSSNASDVIPSGTTAIIKNVQVEKGTQSTSFSPYKTPIELCKIRDYKDKIFKSGGKNLIDIDNITYLNGYYDASGVWHPDVATNGAIEFIEVLPNTTYTFSINRQVYICAISEFDESNTFIIRTQTSNMQTKTITTKATTKYIAIVINYNNGSTMTKSLIESLQPQLELGNSASDFEPYGTSGKWLLHKEISKVVLDGSESNWTITGTNPFYRYRYLEDALYSSVGDNIISNQFSYNFINATNENIGISISSTLELRIRETTMKTIADWKTWLNNHPLEAYYVLAIPSTTEITDTELINQLNSVELLEGMNNISITSGNLSTPLKLTYLSEMDTIDEEYLKDVNVNFGEKFGPVNSVVLSRAAESDSIYQMDEESVEQNGLTEVKIKDNQILNGNNRDEFLPSIFDKLNGLEYYLTDFSSTGVVYYDLLDKYKINVFDNSYKTIMFNNEADITQGLEEQIYANKLEESETDYTKSDKKDRKINQAYIIVDKQNQQINSVVQNINTLQTLVNSQGEQVDALGTRLTQTIDNITASVTSIEGQLENGVNLVKTTSVTIDDSGLNVSTDNSKITTTMTNNSFQIKDSSNNVLAFFGYDETENTSKSQMDNLTVTNYFIAGYHRTEKFERNGEKRTGHFYIG